MAGGPQQTRSIGTATRIYRNSSNKIIAMDCINIVANTVPLNPTVNVYNNTYPGDLAFNTRWHRQALMQFKRCLMHTGIGDRTIAKIEMFGDYKLIDTISGDYIEAKWQGCDNEDDIEVSFRDLPKVGDPL